MTVVAKLDARDLDDRVTFQQKVETQSSTGALTHTWVDFATVWARVDGMKANERYAAQQEIAGTGYTVWIRWRGDVNANMRIVWGSRYLDIKGIPDQQKRGRFLAVFCEEGLNQG